MEDAVKRLGSNPREWLEQRGYVKTFLGWIHQIKWGELVQKEAVVHKYGAWYLTDKYNPNSVIKFTNNKGGLEVSGITPKGGDKLSKFFDGMH